MVTFIPLSVLRFAGFALAVIFGAVPLASASTIIIGNTPNGGDCAPFGCSLWAPQYQQVYAASDFSSALTIMGLTFYNSLGQATNGFNGGTYTISLCVDSAPVNGLDLSNLNNNVGANNTGVFNGTLPQGPVPVGGSDTITFSTPFTYNPLSGLNLLLYVQSSNPIPIINPSPFIFGSYFDANNGTAGGLFSRAENPGCCMSFSDWGLVTGFVTGQVPTVPEPP